jgi:hypothetical protein
MDEQTREQFKELLDEHFRLQDESINKRFAEHSGAMFSYMDNRFGTVDERLNDLGNKFSDLQSSVDNFAGRLTALEENKVVTDHILKRHEHLLNPS